MMDITVIMNYRYNGYKGYKGYNGYNRYKGYNGYNVLCPPFCVTKDFSKFKGKVLSVLSWVIEWVMTSVVYGRLF